MNALLWHILLALLWVAMHGQFTPAHFAVGLGLGLLILSCTRRVVGAPHYLRKVGQILNLGLFFVWELLLANLRVAYDVVTPRHRMRPGVIGIPLAARTDLEITLLSSMISLTPGTLSLDVSADRQTLYIHAMYLEDVEAVRRKIKDGFERRVLEVLR
ncbi:MAG: Na+/H+ antiporter subunit E [Candidatus Tectimicrobiota bacterium]